MSIYNMLRELFRQPVLKTAAVSTMLVAFLGFVAPKLADLRLTLVYSTFWLILGAFVFLILALWDARRGWKPDWRSLSIAAGVSLALAALIWLVVGPHYRVLSDETNLISTSLSMYLRQTLTNITELTRVSDGLLIVNEGVATRPGLYPFLVVLLHFVRGYHASNAFVLNFVVGAATLFTLIAIGKALIDLRFGLLAAALLASFPLFGVLMTSAGFDTLNHFLLLTVLWQLIRFFREPTPLRYELLVVLVALTSQSRYESALLAIPMLMAGALRLGPLLAGRFSWRFALVPLLFLPLIWQRTILGVEGTEGSQPELWGRATFAVGYVWENFCHGLEFFLNPLGRYPTATALVVIAVGGAGLLLYRLRQLRTARPELPALLLVVGTAFALLSAVIFSFLMGDLRTPHNLRFGLVYVGVIALLAAYGLHRLGAGRVHTAARVALVAVALLHYLPMAHRNEVNGALTLPREYERNLSFLLEQPTESTLVVSDRPGLYVAQMMSALSFQKLKQQLPQTLASLRHGDLSGVFVIQHVDHRTGDATPVLRAPVRLVTALSYALTGDTDVRISRMVDVDDPTGTQLSQAR